MPQINKISKKTILIVVTIVLICSVAVAVVFSKNLSSIFKFTNNQQTALSQNQTTQPNSLTEDEQYINNLLNSRSDADRYLELLR